MATSGGWAARGTTGPAAGDEGCRLRGGYKYLNWIEDKLWSLLLLVRFQPSPARGPPTLIHRHRQWRLRTWLQVLLKHTPLHHEQGTSPGVSWGWPRGGPRVIPSPHVDPPPYF